MLNMEQLTRCNIALRLVAVLDQIHVAARWPRLPSRGSTLALEFSADSQVGH